MRTADFWIAAVVLTLSRSLVLDEDDTPEKISTLKRAYGKTYWLWIVIIVFGLVCQSLRSANMRSDRESFISTFKILSLDPST